MPRPLFLSIVGKRPQLLHKAVARECELHRDGRWVMPEAALMAAVVAQHLIDAVDLAARAIDGDPAFAGFPPTHRVAQESRRIGGHLLCLGMDQHFAARTLRRLGVLA